MTAGTGTEPPDWYTPEAHAQAQSTVIDASLTFAQAVFDADADSLWRLLDEPLRDALGSPGNALAVAAAGLGWLRGRELGVSTKPRPIAPGIEVVRLAPLDRLSDEGGMDVHRGRLPFAPIAWRAAENGWRVAGFADGLEGLPV